jgi:hypothetical protein
MDFVQEMAEQTGADIFLFEYVGYCISAEVISYANTYG